ncbi:uncharacterized protein LOC144008098 [Festucalex cinctus]
MVAPILAIMAPFHPEKSGRDVDVTQWPLTASDRETLAFGQWRGGRRGPAPSGGTDGKKKKKRGEDDASELRRSSLHLAVPSVRPSSPSTMTEQTYGSGAPPPPSEAEPGSSSWLSPEQRAGAVLVAGLLLFLAALLVRCCRILVDPYRSMPASNWTRHGHKDALERRVAS